MIEREDNLCPVQIIGSHVIWIMLVSGRPSQGMRVVSTCPHVHMSAPCAEDPAPFQPVWSKYGFRRADSKT